LLILFSLPVRAHEGMWLPTLLKSIESDMHSAGLKLSAEDIYSVNNNSLKDAIVLFGGGCTAEVVSAEGLILTNHHCGFSAIQDHSSLEHDYLKNGYWAKERKDELLNPGLTATFIIRMEDVTQQMLEAIPAGSTEVQRKEIIAKLGPTIAAKATEDGRYKAVVRAFNYGNQFILIVSETYSDVRLVGAPPSSIGNFGADTDNWMWPRHTGDFSLFRIYAGKDGKPSEPSADNVPMRPRHVLPISMEGVKEGDFAMIYGFPGQTQRYLSSYAVDYVLNTGDPLRIKMRQATLDVMGKAMLASDRTRIQYADKQKSIANVWKKLIGEVRGLKELHTVETKQAFEAELRKRAAERGMRKGPDALDSLKVIYAAFPRMAKARDLNTEFYLTGPEIFRFSQNFSALATAEGQANLKSKGKLESEITRLREAAAMYHKDFDAQVDKRIFKALFPIYRNELDPALAQDFAQVDGKYKGNAEAWADHLYSTSVFADPAKLDAVLAASHKTIIKKLSRDPALIFANKTIEAYQTKVSGSVVSMQERTGTHMRELIGAQMELFPERRSWPDANSTLRLSYGQVEGSSPRDGVVYDAFSTLDGVVEKYVPGDHEFDLPQRLIDLHASRDYGDYGVNGTMPVCFTSSLHTTGGNSGSPVLNARGELIGLNFDRTWESTMSDIQFDPDKCRNICVDARYVLFIIDKFAGAGHLVKEMQLVRNTIPGIIELPIHR
jgi:hypothetical protein